MPKTPPRLQRCHNRHALKRQPTRTINHPRNKLGTKTASPKQSAKTSTPQKNK